MTSAAPKGTTAGTNAVQRIWVVEYRTSPDGDWDVSEPFLSQRIAEATCADENESGWRHEGWEFRVQEYVPSESSHE